MTGSLEAQGELLVPANFTRPKKVEAPWRLHDRKSQKEGQRSTIHWVGKAIIGEDNKPTGERTRGASYHGEWQGDKKNGYGIQTYPNGSRYEGGWKDGLRSGEGVLWVRVGKVGNKLRKLYVGGWKADKRHGVGTCFFKSDEYFQGDWEEGKMHGHGQMRYSSGDVYLGDWHNGLRSGQGSLNRANGDCYEGYWLNDKREGTGSYFYASSGKVYVGEWANDLPKSGVYTQAQPNPDQAATVPTTTVIPTVRLAAPVEVLEGALTAVREARKGHRAKHTPVGRLFASEELGSLREAFAEAQRADGTLAVEGMQELCANLGLVIPLSRVEHACAQCGLGSGTPVPFEEFARVVAVLLDDEAMEASLSMELAGQSESQQLDGWEGLAEVPEEFGE